MQPQRSRHGRAPFGQRARLVEKDGAEPRSRLQGLPPPLEQDAVARRAERRRDHDGGVGADAERARTGNDEHGEGKEERKKHVALRGRPAGRHRAAGGEPKPHRKCGNGDGDNDGDKDAADAVGKRLDRRARRLRLVEEAHDAGEDRVDANGGGAHRRHPAPGVKGDPIHILAGRLGHRSRLPREHRIIGGHNRAAAVTVAAVAVAAAAAAVRQADHLHVDGKARAGHDADRIPGNRSATGTPSATMVPP